MAIHRLAKPDERLIVPEIIRHDYVFSSQNGLSRRATQNRPFVGRRLRPIQVDAKSPFRVLDKLTFFVPFEGQRFAIANGPG